MKKRFILLITGIIICLGMLLYFQVSSKNTLKENNVENKNDSMAIMIKEDGEEEYIKSSSNSIPIGDYVLNEEKTTCENGGKISDYNSATGKIKISLLGADKCYLYFDYKESKELYKLIAKRYNNNDTYVKLYSESDASTYANPVYYFNGAVENNNVIFGGFCWKIVRTTDTGGVKMIYNGAPSDEVNLAPIEESEYTNVTNDATYPYTFDSTNKTWTSTNHDNDKTGTITFTVSEPGDYYLNYIMSSEAQYDSASFYKNGTELENHSGTESGTITLTELTTLDIIKITYSKDSGSSSGNDNVVFSLGKAIGEVKKSCNNRETNSVITSIGDFNSSDSSPAYVGYMYNTVYEGSSETIIFSGSFSGSKIVGDSVTYTYNGLKYILNNTSTVSVSSSNISEMVGKYTCDSSSATSCSSPYYIVGYSGTKIYYYRLSGGNTNGASYSNKNYVFGNSFTYANGTYTLSDTVTINSDTFIANKTSVNTHHYTCLTDGTTCTSIYYIYYISDGEPYYITLTNGKSVDDAINEMLYADDVNKNDSVIKTEIDSWYKDNMTSYTNKLEDTVFCNDRTIYSKGGWNPNGGSTTTYLYFKNYNTNYSLACTNETDRFSVSNSKAKLTYPVGLLSAPEVWLAYRNANSSTYYLNIGSMYWLVSPYYYDYFYPSNSFVTSGTVSGFYRFDYVGVRPVISLKPNTEYISGDGSYTNSFIVE